MKTPDEIKKGLECCMGTADCCACPYKKEDSDVDESCVEISTKDALAYIQQLELDLAEARKDVDMLGYQVTALDNAYDAMKRERDAAVEDLKEMGEARPYCGLCAHEKAGIDEAPCGTCREGYIENNWQWRGVQEVE